MPAHEESQVTAHEPNTAPLDPVPDNVIELAVVTGMTAGNSRCVRESRVFAIEPGIGLVWNAQPTKDQFFEALRMVKVVGDTRDLILADLMTSGRELFGEEEIAVMVARLEFNASEIRKAQLIGTLDRSCRTRKLTSEHLHVSARADQLTELERYGWLKKAEELGLSSLELQRSIEAGKVVRLDQTLAGQGRNTGFITVQAIRFEWDQWARKNKDRILNASPEVQRAFLVEIDDILNTAEEIKKKLGGVR